MIVCYDVGMRNEPLSFRRLAAFAVVVLGVAVVGLLLGILAAVGGSFLLQDDLAGFGGIVGAIAGFVIGYPIGVIIGLLLVRRLFHYRGSLWLGAVGSILGGALVIGLAEPLGLNLNPALLWASLLVLSPLLGAIGFHLKRGNR